MWAKNICNYLSSLRPATFRWPPSQFRFKTPHVILNANHPFTGNGHWRHFPLDFRTKSLLLSAELENVSECWMMKQSDPWLFAVVSWSRGPSEARPSTISKLTDLNFCLNILQPASNTFVKRPNKWSPSPVFLQNDNKDQARSRDSNHYYSVDIWYEAYI